MNLPALKKAVVTATSRSRSSRGKQGGNNAKDKEEVEEIKPLIEHKKVKKAHIKKSEKELVVDVETLSFRPADGRLQTARRGRPWVPGNLRGHHRGGGRGLGYKRSQNIESDDVISVDDEGSGKGDDEIETDDKTSYNEWLAAQGLVKLCADQPKQGDIHKLHNKENKSDSVEQTKENNNDDEKTCEYKKEQSEKEQSKIEEVQNREDTGPKCLEIKPPEQKQEVKSVTETVPEKSEVAVGSQSKMAELEKQVELMLQSGQTEADCECKRDTLKDIPKMLQTSEVRKIDKNTENKPEREDKEEHQETQISNIQEQTEVVLKLQFDDIETSDEFNSDSTSIMKNQISEVSDNHTCIDMMVQLHQMLDDTVSVNELVIDESKKEVTDTGKEDDTVTEIINDIVDMVVTN